MNGNFSFNMKVYFRIFTDDDVINSEKERERRQKARREREQAGILHGKVGDKRKKQVRGDHYKTRFRKTFESIQEDEELRLKKEKKDDTEIVSYRTCAAPKSIRY